MINNPYQNYPQYPQMNMPQMNMPQNPAPQIQNGGFVSIPSEDMVAAYPVGMGNCVTFKIEGKPIVIEKSVGFSQLEPPKIERYRLVKEGADGKPPEKAISKADIDGIKDEIDSLKIDLDEMRGEIYALKPKKATRRNTDGED